VYQLSTTKHQALEPSSFSTPSLNFPSAFSTKYSLQAAPSKLPQYFDLIR
jgi:hypothetical protein